eukprot:TRINITY_DN1063_c0_g2_i1.p1 TRINITY_DN1063_c0_g2~~TRINITY_DN1063_c0_g2_i1.p1  ORF type:complete len:532 (-),score=147.42 TRINITY_DN1063_c0_g2_i1:396-1991(-)
MVKNLTDISVLSESTQKQDRGLYAKKHDKKLTSNTLHPGVDNSRQRRKSPVTVQEWVAALPIPHTVQRGLALETQQQKERKNKKNIRSLEDEDEEEDDEEDDEVHNILKEDIKEEVHFSHSKKKLDSRNSSISVGNTYNESSDIEDDNLVLGAEAALTNHIFCPSNKEELNQKRKCRNSLDSRRRYLKESRELYRSFQSDISMKTVSSVDSVLLARELNPLDMLMELGFGGPPTSNLARIPRRFLKDSEVKGISLRNFLSMQDEVLEYGGDSLSYPSVDDHYPFNAKSKEDIVDSFLEALISQPSRGSSWILSRWSSTCSLSRIPPSYTTNSRNSIISSSQSSGSQVKALKGVQAFRAAAQSVLSPANRQFLSEVPKPCKAKRLILGDETLTINEDGELKNNSGHSASSSSSEGRASSSSDSGNNRSLSCGSLESDWSGDDEELRELKRVAQSSAEKNRAILRWKKIRKAAIQKRQQMMMEEEDEKDNKDEDGARLIFPLEKSDDDDSSSRSSAESQEEENDERCLKCNLA